MKNYRTIIAVLVLMGGLTACVQVPVEKPKNNSQLALSSVRDLPIHYAPQSIFSLSPKYLKKVSLKPEQQRAIYQWYSDAIVKNLQAHEYVRASSSQVAKFHVGFGIALGQDLNDEDISEIFGVTPGLNTKGKDEKGSFLIYIDDAVTGQRVWRGTVQGFFQKNISKQKRQERIEHVVGMVLKQYYSK